MSEEKIKTMKPMGIKLYETEISRFKQLKDESDANTDRDFLISLMDIYENPIKIKDNTSLLEKQIAELEQSKSEKIKLSETKIEELIEKLHETEIELAKAQDENDHLKTSNLYLEKIANSNNDKPSIEIEPLNLLILKHVAERESKNRKQEWTIDDVINYFVHFRFEKGSLNGDLKSVSDSDILKLKEKLKKEDELINH